MFFKNAVIYKLSDNFQFDDDTEVPFGLPVRSFKSFNSAAEEAAISRLYGGIHYRAAIDEGLLQGRADGQQGKCQVFNLLSLYVYSKSIEEFRWKLHFSFQALLVPG